jgi:hypothetical protein
MIAVFRSDAGAVRRKADEASNNVAPPVERSKAAWNLTQRRGDAESRDSAGGIGTRSVPGQYQVGTRSLLLGSRSGRIPASGIGASSFFPSPLPACPCLITHMECRQSSRFVDIGRNAAIFSAICFARSTYLHDTEWQNPRDRSTRIPDRTWNHERLGIEGPRVGGVRSYRCVMPVPVVTSSGWRGTMSVKVRTLGS